MIRPRWQGLTRDRRARTWQLWDRSIAILAAINLGWVLFDLSYLPLRSFWLQRNLYPLPSIPLVVPLPWLPDITPWYDPVKGLEPHRDTQIVIEQFQDLDQRISAQGLASGAVQQHLAQQRALTQTMLATNPFLDSTNPGVLENIKHRLRQRSGHADASAAVDHLLGNPYLRGTDWEQERRFWVDQILPLVEINTWRRFDDSGRATDLSWRIDTPFQLLFILDILLRTWRVKRRYPAMRWRDALLRRWIDLPLLLPFGRFLRVIPVMERLSSTRLIQLEPLRAAISRGVVALLALELFEVITIRVVDALQEWIQSPRLPAQIRGLCSYQSTDSQDQREIVDLIQLWLPVILTRIGPNMRPQLVALFSHLLQQSMNRSVIPSALRGVPALQRAESELSLQLAGGAIDSILDVSKEAGERIGRRDPVLEELGADALDRFWEELAQSLEQGPVLEQSQALLSSVLEELKRSSFRQLRDQRDVDALIAELDGLNFNQAEPQTKPPA